MPITLLLVGMPLLFALLTLFARSQKLYALIVRLAAIVIIGVTIVFCSSHFDRNFAFDLSDYSWIKTVMLGIDLVLAAYIIYVGISKKSYLVSFFALSQISLFTWFELTQGHAVHISDAIYIDKLSIVMVAIIGIIGSLICLFAVGYMKDYHHHHTELKDRRSMFFTTLLVFLSAMFGLVISNDMTMMLFFWEITSLCSFLLIGYTKSEVATRNALLALTINVFGGLCFTIGIVLLATNQHIMDFNSLIAAGSSSPVIMASVFLLACAGFTKAAQLPFSKWLLGAMVAPTPTSAMLHSSTMVKAGVYLIIRLSPVLGDNAAGYAVTLIGALTFFITAVLAIAQSDAKKILAYSTISNLGLIVTCAGIGTPEAIWAAIMLIIFHAIAKSLLFLSVGSTEHTIGSRDVEDMDGLVNVSLPLTMLLIIGIAGMFIAPFGMLISKWAAMKAFVDSGNIIVILLVAYGSSVTLFFWTKWMGKLIANARRASSTSHIMKGDEKLSLYLLAFLVIVVCAVHPLLSSLVVIPSIEDYMHAMFSVPISTVSSIIIICMLASLFILPLILVPFYNSHKLKTASRYFAGENTGDDNSYNGSMGETVPLQLRNWYMKDIIDETKILKISYVCCTIVILFGLFNSMGGAFL